MKKNYFGIINEYNLISGENIKINDYITIPHLTVKEALSLDENSLYYKSLNTFIATPYDYMVELYDDGKLYIDLTEWDLFVRLFSNEILPDSKCYKNYKNIIGDYSFDLCKNQQTGHLYFLCKEKDFIIDEAIYTRISAYLKFIHNKSFEDEFNPSRENRSLAKILIERLVQEQRKKRLRKKPQKNVLLGYVNKIVWGAGRSYEEIFNMRLYQFNTGLTILNRKKTYEEIKLAYFTGNMDTKKTKMYHYDWLNK